MIGGSPIAGAPIAQPYLPAAAGAASVSLTGLAATGAVGSLGKTVSVALTGLAATGVVGSLGKTAVVTLSGQAATGAVGDLTPVTGFIVGLTGLAATGAVGALGKTASLALSGAEATGAVGSFAISTPTSISLTGLAATAAVGSMSIGIPVVTGPTPAGRPSKDKKPSKRKRRPVIVSVDGEDFVVNSEAEAEDLILAAREAAEQKAKAEAEEVVRKRQAKAERGSRLNTMPIRLDRPEVQVSSFADQRADPKWIRDLTERFTEVIDSSYEQAARNAEVAVLMKAQAQELDEEDQLVALLFTL